MASSRYWRVSGVETVAGGDLALSELRLHGTSGPLDASVLPTCSHAPSAGAIADLQDGDTTTVCRWAGRAARSSGFRLVWDFGASVSVIASASAQRTPKARLSCSMRWSISTGRAGFSMASTAATHGPVRFR
ncbi:hypothetical protein [Paracidovorax cattleyae]|uniref:hypothetical protein n=1 Tax=Paracidovorax cattleyae TaxID=80868 RepID=UPI0018AF9A00|nr:hypothetical protein [Paracidovorax cattleyae]MBF9263611.1 hypothetical protein [Paracidovorax cattleyae]